MRKCDITNYTAVVFGYFKGWGLTKDINFSNFILHTKLQLAYVDSTFQVQCHDKQVYRDLESCSKTIRNFRLHEGVTTRKNILILLQNP